jgi:hypothetical protein
MHEYQQAIDPDNYVAIGDRVIAVAISARGSTIQGMVIEVKGIEVGRRSYAVEAVAESASVASTSAAAGG